MSEIVVSIVIATYNSEKILPATLDAIKKQTYPAEYIEILLVDGGSTDGTLQLAEKYGCIVYNNPKTEPVNAKMIGMQNAKGRYIISIDHDEVMENSKSIAMKLEILEKHPECKVVLCSGYKRPPNYPLLNQYISEYGDPYSLFMYHFSKGDTYLEQALKKDFHIATEDKDSLVVSFEGKLRKQPIFELCCLGTMIDRDYFMKFPNAMTDGSVFVHLFYKMLEDGTTSVALIKNDSLLHYSVDSLKAYFPKLKWRICNNIHFKEKGEFGYSGREKYQPKMKYKKYLFILYSILVIPALIEGIYLDVTHRNRIYLLHPCFCLYVTFQIIFNYTLKLLKKEPKFRSYDGKSIIKR